MKKLFFTALLAVTVAAGAFAKPSVNVNSNAVQSFHFDFKKATNVTWAEVNEFAKATFVINNQRMEAFYNSNGDKVGTSKSINLEELPVNAKRSFAKRYEGYTVAEAIRFEGTDDAAYFLSAANGQDFVILKIDDNGLISTYQKIKK